MLAAPAPTSAPTNGGGSDYPVTSEPASVALASTCDGTTGQWAGCRGTGCAVCSELTQLYPYYFVNHPLCSRNLTCDGQFATCNANCPPPSAADKEPAPGQCNGTIGQWVGCRGNGCAVCGEKLTAYPFYFLNHPRCVRNDGCAGQFSTCNANCPAPSAADTAPPAGTCNGTPGQWAGCRGNGCSVCAEKLADFPNYFKNHPSCVKNSTCAGQFSTCNSNCPAPTDADRAPPAPRCDGSAGQWSGCRGNGCGVCGELTKMYPYYFANHPSCTENLTCDGQFYTCSDTCPAPADADKAPAAGTCRGTAGTWNACRGNGCAVCSEMLKDYPFYFHHHPSCTRNDTCGGQFYTCNDSCPAPSNKEKLPPAGTCNGSPSGWSGCRGTGCSVCSELVKDYPLYFKNNPLCVKNDTCGGVFAACNSNCSPPTAADRGSSLPDPFQKSPLSLCPAGAELAVAADNQWEVYNDGQRLKPTDATNVESDWHRPAKYSFALTPGTHVFAIRAYDNNGGRTGLIANVKLRGLNVGGGLTADGMDWTVLPAGQAPPGNWTTAESLPWDKPPMASDACKNVWAGDATFNTNWTAVAGTLSPRAWVWNKNCDASQAGWQKENWYRFVVRIRCDSGSTTCPDGTACRITDGNGNPVDVGICRGGTCTSATDCDQISGTLDAAGNLVIPDTVKDLVEGQDPGGDIDIDKGVAPALDGPDSAGKCDPTVGELPPATQDEVRKAQEDANKPFSQLNIPGLEDVTVTPAQVSQAMSDLSDPSKPAAQQVLATAQQATKAWEVAFPKTAPNSYVEPIPCDDQRDPNSPFAGRDIIFVHGFDPKPLMAKQLHQEGWDRASETWASNPESFYTGYYKELADAYWHDHIERYLVGKKNRYLTVAWSTNERMDVAVTATLAQISDAMKKGTGVIATPGDLRGQKAFCVPNCMIVSHSTGAPITDVSMAIASGLDSLKFIPAHMKAHVSLEGAFGGSPWALIAVMLSQRLRAFLPTVVGEEQLCKLVYLAFGARASDCMILPDFTQAVTMDLVPAVSDVWQPLMALTPVPTLTVSGGHATSLFPVLKMLFPGFDDDTLTSNSTCATVAPFFTAPSGYLAFNPLSVFDLGIALERGIFYFIDQRIDPLLFGGGGRIYPGYTASACSPYLSPVGMIQPVDQLAPPPYAPLLHLHNHYSFLQAAAAHSIASISDFGGPNHRYYKDTLGGKRSFEESRIISEPLVYTMRGGDSRSQAGADPGVLVSSAMKTMQHEHAKGWGFRVHFSIFGRRFDRTFWLWKRRYLNLDGEESKDQGDYMYENIATTGPAVPANAPLCPALPTIEAGFGHTCALKADGTVRCWGANLYGKLGNGSTSAQSSVPVPVSGLNDATALAGALDHTCAIHRDGTVSCWGDNSTWQLGNATVTSASTPMPVPNLTGAVAIAAGDGHTCVIKRDTTVWCWGANGAGQLGNIKVVTATAAPVQVTGLTGAKAITCGPAYTCAVLWDGSAKCWGDNFWGNLGNGTSRGSSLEPVAVTGLDSAVAIAAGASHTCAARRNGTMKCWGGNNAGQLGNGNTTDSPTPVGVSGISNVRTIAGGSRSQSSCATTGNGAAWCWGWNGLGEVGNGVATPAPVTTPSPVVNLSTGAAVIKAGATFTCAQKTDQSVMCWGDNTDGQLGNGTTTSSNVPVPVMGL